MFKKISCLFATLLLCMTLFGCSAFMLPNTAQSQDIPPAGTYYISSIGENGDTIIYSQQTEEVLILREDGTGTFYFAQTLYQIHFDDNSVLVNGEPKQYVYLPDGGGEPLLMLVWGTEEANTIAFRCVEN